MSHASSGVRSLDQPLYLNTSLTIVVFLGVLLGTYTCAAILFLCVESPMNTLLRRLML